VLPRAAAAALLITGAATQLYAEEDWKPLLLKRMKVDPAVASGPTLTTVTDMCGFFLVLSFATVMLSRLTVS